MTPDASSKKRVVLITGASTGFGLAGAFEDCGVEEIKGQFETNVFGVVRVCQALIPHMRQRKQGVIVIVGSLAGRIGIPFHSIPWQMPKHHQWKYNPDHIFDTVKMTLTRLRHYRSGSSCP